MSYKFDFVKHRKIYFFISGTIMLLGILSLLIMGLNLGIDFKSGSRLEINIGKAFNEQEIREVFHQIEVKLKEQGEKNVDLNPSVVLAAGNQNELAIVRFGNVIEPNWLPVIQADFKAKYGEHLEINESKVSPDMGKELARNSLYAVLIASIGIILYVTIRFEYRFATAAIIALIHDAFFTITVFSLLRIEVDIPFIAAVLTIVGYSVNDTIVIFDRIRENMRHAKIKRLEDIEKLVNDSLNQTLARSINTVLTVVITALALYIFGGAGIKNFSFALLVGLLSGTYSSIFIASQIWLVWKGKELEKKRFSPQLES